MNCWSPPKYIWKTDFLDLFHAFFRIFTFPTENIIDVPSKPVIAWICGSFKAKSFPKYFTFFLIFMYLLWSIFIEQECFIFLIAKTNTINGLFIWGELVRLRRLARLGEVIFIPRSYGVFYLTAKSLLRHRKKVVLITWLLSGKFIFSIWISEGCNNFILLYDHCFFYSFATSWDFIYISFTYIRFCLSGSACRSHVEIKFGKNSKNTHAL